jgi:hypothetical protein
MHRLHRYASKSPLLQSQAAPEIPKLQPRMTLLAVLNSLDAFLIIATVSA